MTPERKDIISIRSYPVRPAAAKEALIYSVLPGLETADLGYAERLLNRARGVMLADQLHHNYDPAQNIEFVCAPESVDVRSDLESLAQAIANSFSPIFLLICDKKFSDLLTREI
ncbi:MAG: hypothetical protein ABIB61_00775 [Candidatus Shapirobacteria bacterium]